MDVKLFFFFYTLWLNLGFLQTNTVPQSQMYSLIMASHSNLCDSMVTTIWISSNTTYDPTYSVNLQTPMMMMIPDWLYKLLGLRSRTGARVLLSSNRLKVARKAWQSHNRRRKDKMQPPSFGSLKVTTVMGTWRQYGAQVSTKQI